MSAQMQEPTKLHPFDIVSYSRPSGPIPSNINDKPILISRIPGTDDQLQKFRLDVRLPLDHNSHRPGTNHTRNLPEPTPSQSILVLTVQSTASFLSVSNSQGADPAFSTARVFT